MTTVTLASQVGIFAISRHHCVHNLEAYCFCSRISSLVAFAKVSHSGFRKISSLLWYTDCLFVEESYGSCDMWLLWNKKKFPVYNSMGSIVQSSFQFFHSQLHRRTLNIYDPDNFWCLVFTTVNPIYMWFIICYFSIHLNSLFVTLHKIVKKKNNVSRV